MQGGTVAIASFKLPVTQTVISSSPRPGNLGWTGSSGKTPIARSDTGGSGRPAVPQQSESAPPASGYL